jgi:leucine dehydrogenase
VEDLLRTWDGETVIIHVDRPTGAWIVIAIHSTRLGPATGGTRMRLYPSPAAALRDAQNLAASMTLKFALASLPRGGGKAVLAVPPNSLASGARADLLRRYGTLIHQLGGLYQTGPDVGTTSADMDLIAETGTPYVFCRTPAHGGPGDSAPATALGVHHAILATCAQLDGTASLAGKRILVQGAGSVGADLIARLRSAGAEVLFSDVDPATIAHLRHDTAIPYVAPEAVYETPCDLFCPCALGGVLNRDTIPRLRCRAVVGSANNQLAMPEDADLLRERAILYAPDVIANLGGAMAIVGIETQGWSPAEADARVIAAITDTLHCVYDIATAEHVTTVAAMHRIADQRLADPT